MLLHILRCSKMTKPFARLGKRTNGTFFSHV
ncbi:unnamed protein product [Debaryomyces tyrocola]|nr:unnamed protein product [Debaryomyces tyrocola]